MWFLVLSRFLDTNTQKLFWWVIYVTFNVLNLNFRLIIIIISNRSNSLLHVVDLLRMPRSFFSNLPFRFFFFLLYSYPPIFLKISRPILVWKKILFTHILLNFIDPLEFHRISLTLLNFIDSFPWTCNFPMKFWIEKTSIFCDSFIAITI